VSETHKHTKACYSPIPETEGKGEWLSCGKVAGQPGRESAPSEAGSGLRELLAKELHQGGLCGSDYGNWERVIAQGYECTCFDYADKIIPIVESELARARAEWERERESRV
jgi:hypothetical protein